MSQCPDYECDTRTHRKQQPASKQPPDQTGGVARARGCGAELRGGGAGASKNNAVTIGPTDFGSSCRDAGTLVSLGVQKVVMEAVAMAGQSTESIHAPRQQFGIKIA
ncbi:hypothetical protein HC256_005912 [Beauveria bassiana]|nr:hypothetical protein HC256_005912 [Beauveria bassiana]